MEIRSKCEICKDFIVLDNIDYDEIMCKKLKGKLKFIHIECFVEKEMKKSKNKSTKEKMIEKCKKRTQILQNEINDYITEKQLIMWLGSAYNRVSISSWFYLKLQDVIDGSYKDLTKGIPISELFEMWQRYKHELDKIDKFNQMKHKKVDRLSYDLAILISKYDDFKQWKESEKAKTILDKESLKHQNEKINYNKIKRNVSKPKPKQDDKFDFNDVLDEI